MSVAGRSTELADGTQSTAREPKGVVREDGLSRPVIVLVLYLVDEHADVDTDRACLLAGAVCALHATGCLLHCFLLGVEASEMVTGPVVMEGFGGCSLEFYFVFVSVLLARGSVNDLGFVKMRSSGENCLLNVLAELREPKASHGAM